MTPLDDELRRTLSSRAAVVAPSADPLAGIEARASRIRRRRTLAAVSGAAAVVAAVAFAVPAVVPDRDAKPTQFATPTPTAATVTQSDAVLDPDHPWTFRGTPLSAETRAAFQQEWTARHPDGGRLTPLWSEVYEPSNQQEMAFVASDGRYGFVRARESGPEFEYDAPLASGTTALLFVLPGDEVPRLVVVAAPSTQKVEYAPDGTTYRNITVTGVVHADGPSGSSTTTFDGIGTTALEGDLSADRVRVTGSSGSLVYDQPAPNKATDDGVPSNVVSWQERGDSGVGPPVHELLDAFAQAMGHEGQAGAAYQPLFIGDTDSGVHYTLGQAWFQGDAAAHTVSYATGGTNGPELFLGRVTPMNAWGLAYLIGNLPGTSVDLLVVVPRPMIGEISYSPDATSAFQPKASGRSDLNGIAFIDRAKDATNDRLQALDGDGDLDHPLYRGPVAPLLCGVKECG